MKTLYVDNAQFYLIIHLAQEYLFKEFLTSFAFYVTYRETVSR